MTDFTRLPRLQSGMTDPDRPDDFQDRDQVLDPLEPHGTTRAIVNPPGQSRLTYRVGDYASFLQSMLLRLHSQTVSWTDGNDVLQTQRPLRHLNITRHPNWIVALLQAWAVVGDVLTFYQEQIANEGYLATATESLSVRELLRTIGYELHPGVAASTYLAFTLLDAPTAPDRVLIPVGTAVQSLPPSVAGIATPDIQSPPTRDQLPVTFETIAPIEARVAWNALPVYLPTQRQAIRQDSTQLLLRGIKTGVRPGDALLLLTVGGTAPAWLCRMVQTVTPNPAQGWTQVSWQLEHDDTPPGVATLPTPQILTFRKQAALFGKDVPNWDTLPDVMKQKYGGSPDGGVMSSSDSGQTWQSVHQAFIGKTVRALRLDANGHYVAATDTGVLRSRDRGQTWQTVNAGLTRKDVYALTPTDSGDLLAGSADGAVFRLRLGSDRWETVRSTAPNTFPTAATTPTTTPTSLTLYALAAGTHPKTHQSVYFMGTQRGLLRSLDNGTTWMAIGVGLPGWNKAAGSAALTVYAIALQTTTNTILIGTDRGIFVSSNGGNTWKAANRGLTTAPPSPPSPQAAVAADLAQAQETLEQGQTDLQEARDRIQDASTRLRPVLERLKQVTQTVGAVIPSPILSLVGTVTGLATRLADQTKALQLTLPVNAQPIALGLPTHALLLVNSTGAAPLLVAGTDQGLFRSLDGGNTWTAATQPANVNDSLAGVPVRSLISRQSAPAQTELLAGTDRGLYCSHDQGVTWTPLSLTTAVSDLVASADGQLLALTPFLGLREPIEQLRITNHHIDLDKVYTTIACDSWIVLQQAPPASPASPAPPLPKTVACRVTQVATATRQIRSKTVTVTRLQIDPTQTDADLLQAFDPRQTIVQVQSEVLPLFETSIALPIRGHCLRLSGSDLDLQPGQTLSLVGKHPTIRLVTEHAITLTSLDSLESIALQSQKRFDLDLGLGQWLQQRSLAPELQNRFQDNQIALSPQVRLRQLATGDRWLLQDITADGEYRGYLILKGDRQLTVYETVALQVIAPATSVPGHPNQRVWRVMTATGFEGTVTLTTADYLWEPATPASDAIGETIRVLDGNAFVARHYTLVRAHEPLRYLYDPCTVSLCGNVAPATQGETVRKEVLGTGDASRQNQQFVLKKPPLTYVPAPTADGTQSTLEVRVRSGLTWGPVQSMGALNARRQEMGSVWSEVPSLANSTPQDHHYTVRVNHDGKTTISFGDGTQGARLPSGMENVEATYRSGMGIGGNLEPDRLVLPKNRPPGIRNVTNPLPAMGGTDAERLETAKLKAPHSLRALQRIISLTDYEDFASGFAGVGKAQVQRVWNGHANLIHLTIAAADGSPADPVMLLQPLHQAIRQYQAASLPVQLDPFLARCFNLSATVLIQPDLEKDAMHDAIAQSLTQAFSFPNRQFGQPIAASEVITAIQLVPGVVAVDLLTLHRYGAPPQLNPLIFAAQTHWDTQQQAIVPAELLQLNTRTGINLSIAHRP